MLVCPNCSAQYEIDGSMIPDDGRDVQCSNCGHTWFELPGPSEAGSGTGAGLETGTSEAEPPKKATKSLPFGWHKGRIQVIVTVT